MVKFEKSVPRSWQAKESTLTKLKEIRQAYDLPSYSETLRKCVSLTHRQLNSQRMKKLREG